LKEPEIRARVIEEMKQQSNEWDNLYLAAGSPENLILIGFKNDDLKHLTGKTLAEVAQMRGTSAEDTMIDLVIEDDSRVGTAYFLMSEQNVKKKIAQPWVAFGSDAESLAPEGVFLKSNPHPRAYGTFARLLGKYVRDEQVVSLPEAIRRLTSFPAENLGIKDRGSLKKGFYADIAVFDPGTIRDNATFAEPHQYATGVHHVLVNGVPVLLNGEHTGATPGRFVKGPGYKGQ
jgi:N-acyl-D-amino-acid deacylase